MGWCGVFVEVEARGGRPEGWDLASGGACLESESEEKEDVSLELAVGAVVDLVVVVVSVGGMLTDMKRRSSSSRLSAQSFMYRSIMRLK